MEGGLDETTQAIAIKRGRAIAVLNHECVNQGYARVSGYERFDGSPSPSSVFEALDGDPSGPSARDEARGQINPVPGTGPVRGVWQLNGQVYAWRDNSLLTQCIMYKSSPSGWIEVPLGFMLAFTSGGTYEIKPGDIITGATSTKTALVRKVVLTSGKWTTGTAAGYMVLASPNGTLASENLNVAANLDVATITTPPSMQGFPAGGRYDFVTHNFYASATQRCFYGVNGVGRAFEVDRNGAVTFVVSNPDATLDKPTALHIYKEHLFLGFPQGSITGSQPGDPLLWDGALGATEIGIGSPVTGFSDTALSGMFVFSEGKISALNGNNVDDFLVEVVTDEGGAFPWTMHRVTQVLYMNPTGVRVISPQLGQTFITNKISRQIEKTLQAKTRQGIYPTASCVVQEKFQYRVFFSDGSGISIFFGRKYPEAMAFALGTGVSAYCAYTSSDELTLERTLIGAANGFVYDMDRGTSYDGEAIDAYLQFTFDHEGSPLTLKKWHKISFEVIAAVNTQIKIAAEFDYASTDQPGVGLVNLDVAGGIGGTWSISQWDEFDWSSPIAGVAENWIDGVGLNLSVIVVSTSSEQMPYTLQGATKSYSIRGQRR